MIELKVSAKETVEKDLYLKIDETGDHDVVVDAVAASSAPEDGEGFWWKKTNAFALRLAGIWADGATEATLVIDELGRIVEIRK
jgi:hypothetical protein